MTKSDDLIAATDSMIAGIERMIAESRAIDTRAALQGISPNRDIRRTHTHSRRHRAYNR